MFNKLRIFIFSIHLRIKLMSDSEFEKLLNECCSDQEKMYALCFRYY